ncbi:very long chain fatty acid elongase 1 isoform X2 [Halictus rubicundus]|uniref:very long chain fatty acid elongase 1 isoform X2 n=1 Tax=Halictus rubicundus TaxID=77578 RepID=UPI0040361314
MGIIELYNRNWNEGFDQRTKDLPFVTSNYIFPSILIVYLYIVLKWLPDFMKNKQPYNLKSFIRCYNIFQIVLNTYIIVRFVSLGALNNPTRLCIPPDYSFHPVAVQIAHTVWFSWMSSVIDLIETVVFLLRKKNEQVSFLHLYHHVTVLLLGWYTVRFYAVEMAARPIMLNCFIHVVMYSYYYFSSYGSETPKIIRRMKPHLTRMQMVQFVLLGLYGSLVFLPSCPLPKSPMILNGLNVAVFFLLFHNFYRKSYKTQEKQKN